MVSMEVMDAISNRRSIRKYQDKPVPEETVLKIVEAGVRAPCGCSLQKYSIIWVKDEEKRKILWESCRKYPFILEAPVTLAICADLRNLLRMIYTSENTPSIDNEVNLISIKHKFKAIFDAGLVAENMTIAAESFGLGSVFIGSAFANLNVIETLNLPTGVFPLCLLCIGYPDEDPSIRPRLPLHSVLFIDEYKDLTKEKIEDAAQNMNADARVTGNTVWIKHAKRKLSTDAETERKLKLAFIKTGFLSNENIDTYVNVKIKE